MSGRLLVKDITPKRTKHEHVTMTLSNGKLLSLIDPRRFGLVLWIKTLNHPVLKKLGKEPLTKDFSHDYLYNAAQKRKITIKQLIMDNRIVAGIGNIYASEALFAAKIYPLTPANKLNSKQCQILVTKIKSILKSAIKNRGTTFRDYVDGSGMSGNFQKYLKVYGRENQPCKSCRTKLQNIKIGQRNTIYCLKCQNQGNESQPSL
jgi:formamidopyrimidine-DNA glycosylase